MCGARRRPPYCTKMTRDMGTCSNALRITWFWQRHLTSTLANYRAANSSSARVTRVT